MLLWCGDAHGIDRDRRLDQLQHTRWTKADGVPGAVRALAQTTDGYLWLATTNGLVRYDGSQFEVWEPRTGPGLISPNVRALLATPDGALWIGYVAPGVSFLKNGTLTNYGAKDGLPDSQVYSFAIDKQGRTWLSALWSGLYRLDGSHWAKSVTDFTGLAAPLLVDRRGTLWVGTATDVQYLSLIHIFASDHGYSFLDTPLRPRLSVKADLSSGDDPNKKDLGTFNPIFPLGNYFGVLASTGPGPVNFMDIHPRLQTQFPHGVTVSTDWVFQWRQSTLDGIYTVPGSLLRPTGTSRARYVGDRPGIEVKWQVDRHLWMQADYGIFYPGSFIKQTQPGRDLNYWALWTGYKF